MGINGTEFQRARTHMPTQLHAIILDAHTLTTHAQPDRARLQAALQRASTRLIDHLQRIIANVPSSIQLHLHASAASGVLHIVQSDLLRDHRSVDTVFARIRIALREARPLPPHALALYFRNTIAQMMAIASGLHHPSASFVYVVHVDLLHALQDALVHANMQAQLDVLVVCNHANENSHPNLLHPASHIYRLCADANSLSNYLVQIATRLLDQPATLTLLNRQNTPLHVVSLTRRPRVLPVGSVVTRVQYTALRRVYDETLAEDVLTGFPHIMWCEQGERTAALFHCLCASLQMGREALVCAFEEEAGRKGFAALVPGRVSGVMIAREISSGEHVMPMPRVWQVAPDNSVASMINSYLNELEVAVLNVCRLTSCGDRQGHESVNTSSKRASRRVNFDAER